MLVFHWSRFTLTQCLFFIGHGLHPRNACFSLVTAYTHAILVFHWSRFTPTQYLFFIGNSLHPRNACFSLGMVYMHALFSFRWQRLTFTQCLFFIGHGLHPRNACFSLVKAYTHAFLVSRNHFVDFIYSGMYLSATSAGFITRHIIHSKPWEDYSWIYFPKINKRNYFVSRFPNNFENNLEDICFDIVYIHIRSLRDVVANAIDFNIVVSEFEVQSGYYVHLRAYAPWKRYEPPYLPARDYILQLLSLYEDK